MSKTKYKPEIIEFIKVNNNKGYKWLSHELNAKFNLNTTLDGIRFFCQRNNIKIKNGNEINKKFTDEILDFIIENNDKGSKWLIENIKSNFNVDITQSSLHTITSKKGIKLDKSKYKKQHIDFIRENAYLGFEWLVLEMNKRFNLNVNANRLGFVARENNIKIKMYTNGWNGYHYLKLKELYGKYPYEKICQILKEEFDFDTIPSRLVHQCSRWNFSSRKNNVRWNDKRLKPIGTEMLKLSGTNKNKKIYIKYRDLKSDSENRDFKINWMPKPRWVWEKHYGEIPKDCCIIQLDGDFQNCNIENLRMIPKTISARIAKSYGKGIITEAMLEIAMLEEKLKEELL